MARTSRAKLLGTTDLAGDFWCYEDTALSSGVPTDKTKAHIQILNGGTQSFKCATSISNQDYCIITQVYMGVRRSNAAAIDVTFEVSQPNELFHPRFEFSTAQGGGPGVIDLDPYIIVPKNSDVRIRAATTVNGTTVTAGWNSHLAIVL